MPAICEHPEGVTLAIQVQPRSSRTEVSASDSNQIRLRVAAPPVDGAANQEVVAWLSKKLSVPKSGIRILTGERGRRKVILIPGMLPSEVCVRLGLS